MCFLIIFMATLKVAFQTPLVLLSIKTHRLFNRKTSALTLCLLSRENTAGNKIPPSLTKKNPCPHGAILQVGRHTSTPLYHHETSVRGGGEGAAFTLPHFKGRGLPQNHTQAVPRPLCLAPQVGSVEHSRDSLETILPRAERQS